MHLHLPHQIYLMSFIQSVEEKNMTRKRIKIKENKWPTHAGLWVWLKIYSFGLGRELRKIKFGHVLVQIR
jgi:hypothetical protein